MVIVMVPGEPDDADLNENQSWLLPEASILVSIVHIDADVMVPSAKTFGTLDNIAATKANAKITTVIFSQTRYLCLIDILFIYNTQA